MSKRTRTGKHSLERSKSGAVLRSRIALIIVAIAAAACSSAPGGYRSEPEMPPAMMPAPAPPADAMMSRTAEESYSAGEPIETKALDGDADGADEGGRPGAVLSPETAIATREVFTSREPALLARWEGENRTPLPLDAWRVSLASAGTVVRVAYDMVFRNPSDRRLQGTLMVSLPPGASPAWFSTYSVSPALGGQTPALLPEAADPALMLDGEAASGLAAFPARDQSGVDWGQAMPARVARAVESRSAYEEVVRRGVDPALGEWSGAASFSVSVFPLEPGTYKRLVFVYDVPARLADGRLLATFALPYASAALEGIVVSAGTGATLSQLDGHLEPDADGIWRVDPAALQPPLSLASPAAAPDLTVMVGRDEALPGSRLVHVTIAPTLPEDVTGLRKTGRAVFLLDTSYSTGERLYRESGRLLRAILEHDDSITEFAVVAFDLAAVPLTAGFVPNMAESRDALFRDVERVRPEGATNLASALAAVAALPEPADACFLLSDGIATWDADDPAELARAYPGVFGTPWFCYAPAGTATNTPMLAALSRAGGAVVDVPASWDAATIGVAHRRPLSRLDLVSTARQDELTVEGDPRSVYAGMTLAIALRLERPDDFVDIELTISGVKKAYRVPLGQPASGPIAGEERAAARWWARVQADRLLSLRDAAADEVAIALSQRFGLANRAASFIMLESEDDYVRYGIEPAAVSFAPHELRVRSSRSSRPLGEPDLSIVPKDRLAMARELVETLGALSAVRAPGDPAYPWITSAPELSSGARLDALFAVPRVGRQDDFPESIFGQAMALSATDPALAARILSTAVELRPADDETLRLVGYGLMQAGMWDEAADLFRRLRIRRPYEPQGFLLEAIAATAAGDAARAILLYEVAMAHPSTRFSEFCMPVAVQLYAELLDAVWHATKYDDVVPPMVEKMRTWLAQPAAYSGRMVLFWNIDDTDIDLHVVEANGFKVYYGRRESPTGGRLHWDNTTGLGPELYDHPKIPARGFSVGVNYFGTRSADGSAPAATLVLSWTRKAAGARPELRVYTTVLASGKEGVQPIVPGRWKP